MSSNNLIPKLFLVDSDIVGILETMCAEKGIQLANVNPDQLRVFSDQISSLYAELVKCSDATPDDLLRKGNESNQPFLNKVNRVIEKNLTDDNLDNDFLANRIGVSRSQLYRKLKLASGKSTALYIRSIRLNKSLELLKKTDLPVSEIAYAVGFSDPAYFSRVFAKEFSTAPSKCR